MSVFQLPLDIQTAAFRHLYAHPIFRNLVSEGLVGSDEETDWLFQGVDGDARPRRDPEGSGTSAVVLMQRSPWATRNQHNTMTFPVLQILVYMDSTRDEAGAPVRNDAASKCRYVCNQLDRIFHVPDNRVERLTWDSLRLMSSLNSHGPEIMPVPETEEMTMRGEMRYDIALD